MVERQVECGCCGGAGEIEVSEDRFDPSSAYGHYTVEHIVTCRDCDGTGRRTVRLDAPCALCGEREASPTVAVFTGSACCSACAADIDEQLGRVEVDPLPFELGYKPLRRAGGVR